MAQRVKQLESAKVAAKREVVVVFFQMEFKTSVLTGMAEVQQALWAVIKKKALGKKQGLPMFPWERVLCNVENPDGESEAPPEVIQDMVVAREMVLDILQKANAKTIKDMHKKVTASYDAILEVDPSLKIEMLKC